MKVSNVIFAIFAVFPAIVFSQVDDLVSQFCPDCTDISNARLKAISLAPNAQCDYGNPPQLPPISCSPVSRRVVLGNHLTGQIFVFLITVDELMTNVVEGTLTDQEAQAIDAIFELRQAWSAIDFNFVVDHGVILDGFGHTSVNLSDVVLTTKGGEVCPSGTALEAVLDQALLQPLRDEIAMKLINDLQQRFEDLNPSVNVNGISVVISNFGFSMNWENVGNGPGVATFEFTVSETNTPIPDRLVFDLSFNGFTASGSPIINSQLNTGSSRAAGVRVSDLVNGSATVDNDCVLAKLAALQDQGFGFNLGGAGGPEVDFNGSLFGPAPRACSASICMTVCSSGSGLGTVCSRSCIRILRVGVTCG